MHSEVRNKYGYKILPLSFMEIAMYRLKEFIIGKIIQFFWGKSGQTFLYFSPSHI
jgi:hypothetical protein